MNKLLHRLYLLIILSLIFIYIAIPWKSLFNIDMPFSGQDYRLGLDLQWWIELDYRVDLSEVRQNPDFNRQKQDEILEWLKSIIDRRVESLNINDSIITTANYSWEQHIIVQIPMPSINDEEAQMNINRAKEAIWRVMRIEFRERRTTVTQEDIDNRKKIAENFLQEYKDSNYNFLVESTRLRDSTERVEIWTLLSDSDTLSQFIPYEEQELWLEDRVLYWTWVVNLWDNNFIRSGSESWYWIFSPIYEDDSELNISEYRFVYISSSPSEWKPAMDSQGRILNDRYFVNSSVQFNEAFRPMVELTFNNEWARIFWELTRRLVWQQIAIFVWWEMLTAPNVNEPILNWRAVITGDYTADEARKLSQDINTWVVPAPIYLTSERTIDSRLWMNSLEQLIIAWIAWYLLILFFLIIVYRWAWFAAWVALIVYLFAILAIVKTTWVILTLASIAWLLLSVGIAIDANILIFERIKDELRNKKTKLDKSIQDWFSKSWTAIWDANLTWLIISIILFIFGINMIKWFWLMLWIWIIVSLFSAMFVSRLFILIISKKKDLSLKAFIWFRE